MGFATTFRFGNPFFLAPNVDEVVKRFRSKTTFDRHWQHTIKTGGEWVHTKNVQVFRGFFEGRYIFDSVTGLCVTRRRRRREDSAVHRRLLERRVRHGAGELPRGLDGDRRSAPLLPAEQQPGRHCARRAGASDITMKSSRCSCRTNGRPVTG